MKGYRARCILGGLRGGPRRAAYWRELGFPNLAKGRTVRLRNLRARKQQEELALARIANPLGLPEDAEHWASVAREQLGLPARKNPRFVSLL